MGVRNGAVPSHGSAAGQVESELVPGADESEPAGDGAVAKGREWVVGQVESGRADICSDLCVEFGSFRHVEGPTAAAHDAAAVRVQSGGK